MTKTITKSDLHRIIEESVKRNMANFHVNKRKLNEEEEDRYLSVYPGGFYGAFQDIYMAGAKLQKAGLEFMSMFRHGEGNEVLKENTRRFEDILAYTGELMGAVRLIKNKSGVSFRSDFCRL